MAKVHLMFQPLVRYVDFQGRSRRSEYWLWCLFRFILGAVMITVMLTMVGSSVGLMETNPAQFMAQQFTLMPIIQLIDLALLLPTLAVSVRRLHDINRTGWWILLPFAAMLLGVIAFLTMNFSRFASLSEANADPSAAFAVLGSAFLFIWLPTMIASLVLFVFSVLDGTAGPNRFGPDPKGRGNTAVF